MVSSILFISQHYTVGAIKKLHCIFVAVTLSVSLGASTQSYAAPIDDITATTNEQVDAATTASSARKEVIDSFGRQTPRSTVQGFITALADSNTNLATNYLELNEGDNGIELVRQLNLALDTGGRLFADLQISNDPRGNLADKLPPDQELVGTVTLDNRTIDLILKRRTAPQGNQYWQFSAETIRAVKQADIKRSTSLVEQYKLESLAGITIHGYDLSHVVAVFLLALTCLIFAYAFVGIFYLLLSYFYPYIRHKRLPVDGKVILPLALILTSVVLSEVMVYAGVSVTVREPVIRIKDIVAWFALTWLLLRVIDAVFNRAERLSYKHNHTERVSILTLLRKVVKALLLILAMIYIFGNLGFDLTTGIAALGVGGLALALGAQKMIENLVGSVVVVADQPVRVGDYCKFGEQEGTVIDIGIRSTRIRTLNRTIVTVPNGDFSSMQIENFAPRDMFIFLHNFYLKRTAQAEVLRSMIDGLNDYLEAHELTNSEWNQVRLAELRQDCFVVEIKAYIYAEGIADFYGKQTQLIIDLLKEVENYDVEHALPSHQMFIEESEKLRTKHGAFISSPDS